MLKVRTKGRGFQRMLQKRRFNHIADVLVALDEKLSHSMRCFCDYSRSAFHSQKMAKPKVKRLRSLEAF